MPEQQYRSPDAFDRMAGALANLPVATSSKPTTVSTVSPLIGASQSIIIRTIRQREVGDHLFIECCSADGLVRMYLPPEAAAAIARQRDSLTTKVRRKAGKAQAAERKARGEVPAFLNGRKAKAE